MKSNVLGKRYAKAIFELAEKENQSAKVLSSLSELSGLWENSKELRELFVSPNITKAERRKVIEALSAKMSLSLLLQNALLLISDRGRMLCLPEITQAFSTLFEEKNAKINAEVTTAIPMPDSFYQALEKVLEEAMGKKVTLEKKQDSFLLGGIITRVGDKVYDGSLRTRLSELREELI